MMGLGLLPAENSSVAVAAAVTLRVGLRIEMAARYYQDLLVMTLRFFLVFTESVENINIADFHEFIISENVSSSRTIHLKYSQMIRQIIHLI